MKIRGPVTGDRERPVDWAYLTCSHPGRFDHHLRMRNRDPTGCCQPPVDSVFYHLATGHWLTEHQGLKSTCKLSVQLEWVSTDR